MAQESVTVRTELDFVSTGVDDVVSDLNNIAAASEKAAIAQDKTTKSVESAARSLRGLAQGDEAYRAIQKVETAQRRLNEAMSQGLGSTAEFSAAQRVLAQRQEEVARLTNAVSSGVSGGHGGANDNAFGLNNIQMMESVHIVKSIADELIAGQNPMRAFAMEGGRIWQTLTMGGNSALDTIKAMGSGLAGMITPITAVGAAMAATVGLVVLGLSQWQNAQDKLTISMNGLGAASGLTLGQVNSIAAQAGAASGISTSAAQSYAAQYLGAGVSGGSLGGAIDITKDFSKKLGLSMDDAAGALSKALADPSKGAQDLATKYGLLTRAQMIEIDTLTGLGDKSGATAKLIDDLRGKLASLEDPTWRIGKAWDDMGVRISNFLNKIGMEMQGPTPASTVFERMRTASAAATQAQNDRNATIGQALGKITVDGDLAAKSILATTYAQREAVVIEKARVDALVDAKNTIEIYTKAEADLTKMRAESIRQAADIEKQAGRNLDMAAMTPYEKARQAVINTIQDARERLLPTSDTNKLSDAFGTAATSAKTLSDAFVTAAAAITKAPAMAGAASPAATALAPPPMMLSPLPAPVVAPQPPAAPATPVAPPATSMNAPTLMPLAPTLNAQPMGDAINTFGTAGKAAGALADAFNSAALTIGKSAADVATKTTAGLPFFASLGATTGSADALSTALRNAADAAAASARASSTVGSLDLNKAASAIKAIESLGSGGYSAVGPTTKSGDNAYGAYQVMGENVGPWSKKWTGAEMTPGQFLKDPTAQDAVFTGQFSALVQKFGNVADAVSAWFTGKPLAQGANKSDGYTTGSQYVAKFQKYYGQDASGSASNDNSARSQVANSLDSAQAKGLAQVDIEFYDNKVKTLNLDLDKQKAALGLVRDAFGQSADAVATASKAQDLFNQFESQGVKLTSDQKQALTELAAKFAEVAKATKEAQQANADYIKGMDSVRGLVGGSATSFLTGLAQGNKPKDLLKSMLGNVESQGIGSAVGSISDLVFGQKGTTGSDTIGGAIFGKADSIGKSLFDGIAGAFGFGGGKSASTQQMTVNASTVNVSGGLAGGASGLLGGGTNGGALLGSLGSLFNGGASSSLSSAGSGIGGFFSSIMSALPFAEGGVMTSAGPVPLRAYAAGGVATSPQMSLFGEGGTPEAYVPLRDGRTIPVSLQGGGGGGNGGTSVSVHNYAGVDIEPRVTAGHVELIVGKRVAQAMAQVPTMMQDYQRRTA